MTYASVIILEDDAELRIVVVELLAAEGVVALAIPTAREDDAVATAERPCLVITELADGLRRGWLDGAAVEGVTRLRPRARMGMDGQSSIERLLSVIRAEPPASGS